MSPNSATTTLHRAGQSLWLDHITRDLLTNGTLDRYIDDLSLTGLTSNPTIYERAIRGSAAYDDQIRRALDEGQSVEDVFFTVALADLRQAADAFRVVYMRTSGVDGWVSLEVSPMLVRDAEATVEQARRLHDQAERPNLYIKIPGTPEGLWAIEEAVFSGIHVNVTLLFNVEQYLAAAAAYMRGLERRAEAGLDVAVSSVASVFMSRWDVAVADSVPGALANRLGLAMGHSAYRAYRETLEGDRWQRLANLGARPQRLLFASTGTKDPAASDVLYITGLAAPNTVNTMPEDTLLAYADHGEFSGLLPADGGAAGATLAAYEAAGVDVATLGQRLQDEGAESFAQSWHELMERLSGKVRQLAGAG